MGGCRRGVPLLSSQGDVGEHHKFWVEKNSKNYSKNAFAGKKEESAYTHSAMHCTCLYIIIEVSIGIQIAVHACTHEAN